MGCQLPPPPPNKTKQMPIFVFYLKHDHELTRTQLRSYNAISVDISFSYLSTITCGTCVTAIYSIYMRCDNLTPGMAVV